MGCSFSEPEEDAMSLNFLVILKKSDFASTIECLNKKSIIKRTLRKLPGNVHIAKFDDTKFFIKGLKMPYVLYTKLPKEGIYVTSDAWDNEYFNSQILELIQIFTALGSTEIRFDTSNEHNSEKQSNINMGLKLPNVPLKLSAEAEQTEITEEASSFGGLIRIKSVKPPNYTDINDFITKNQLYYTKFYPEWKGLIEYKLSNSITKLNFEFTFHRGFYCSSSLGVDLEKIGISCKLINSANNSTTVSFRVNF